MCSNDKDLEKSINCLNTNYNMSCGKVLINKLDISSKPKGVSWPDNESPGVYILLDGNKKILYIGKASFGNCIGGRLNKRFDRNWNSTTKESKDCQHIYTIPLINKFRFEAPAIEEFLLSRLKTKHNSIGKMNNPAASC